MSTSGEYKSFRTGASLCIITLGSLGQLKEIPTYLGRRQLRNLKSCLMRLHHNILGNVKTNAEHLHVESSRNRSNKCADAIFWSAVAIKLQSAPASPSLIFPVIASCIQHFAPRHFLHFIASRVSEFSSSTFLGRISKCLYGTALPHCEGILTELSF